MVWLILFATAGVALALSSLFAYIKNYRLAATAKFPIQICIGSGLHPIFLIGGVDARDFFRKFPWPISTFGQHAYYGWSYDDHMGGKIHDKLGPIWTSVSSWGNELTIADPDVAMTVHTKWKIFTKHPNVQAMALFGPNLDTVEGNDWNKHRRLTAPCFNDRTSEVVWSESRAQALGMLEKLKNAGTKGVQSVADDTQSLACNVLMRIAFGMQTSFEKTDKLAPGFTMPFNQAIQVVIRNLILCVMFGAKLASPRMPAFMREAGRGFVEYDRYVQDIVDREKAKMESGSETSNNLISVMLRAVETDKQEADHSKGSAFTEADVRGNCFIFAVAGHDTTANSLAFAIALLSSRPQMQDWMVEEINAVIGDSDEPDYEKHFPRLVRCQAALFETLRLYPAVPELPKYTGDSYRSITFEGKEHLLPPHMLVRLNVVALHRLKKHWGNDVDEWRPERWIVKSSTESPNNTGTVSKTATTNHQMETIKEPYRGSYMPWAEGPRICPGNKFARVEFVSTIVTLLRYYKVKPLPLDGESDAQARGRAMAWAKDCHARGVAINLKRPESVTLVWEPRL